MRDLKQDWRDLLLSFRIALHPSKMLLGMVELAIAGVLTLVVVLVLIGPIVDASNAVAPGATAGRIVDTRVLTETGAATTRGAWQLAADGEWGIVKAATIHLATQWSLSLWQWIVAIVGGLLVLLVCSVFGGAITRMATVEIARDELLEAGEGWAFAKRKWRSLFGAPVGAVVAILGLFVLILAWGFFTSLPIVGFLAALGFVAAVVFGVFMAVVLVGAALGWGLFTPAIAAEGSDSFDGFSRAFAYVFERPWHYLWYGLVAKVIGILSAAVVIGFTVLAALAIHCPARMMLGDRWDVFVAFLARQPYAGEAITFGRLFDGSVEPFGLQTGWIVIVCGLFTVLTAGLVLGYLMALCYTLRAGVYLLLRKATDGTPVDDIYYEGEGSDYWAVPPPEEGHTDAAAGSTEPSGDEAPAEAGPGPDPDPEAAPAAKKKAKSKSTAGKKKAKKKSSGKKKSKKSGG